MDYAEGADHGLSRPPAAADREHRQRSSRWRRDSHSTSARAAAPSARAPHRIADQDQHRLFELRSPARTWMAAPLADERLGDLDEVLHVRAEHDRLAEHRRLEDVVAAGRTRLPPTKTTVAIW